MEQVPWDKRVLIFYWVSMRPFWRIYLIGTARRPFHEQGTERCHHPNHRLSRLQWEKLPHAMSEFRGMFKPLVYMCSLDWAYSQLMNLVIPAEDTDDQRLINHIHWNPFSVGVSFSSVLHMVNCNIICLKRKYIYCILLLANLNVL